MSTISASTTSTTAYKVTADITGTLVFQTGATPTTAMTLGADQSVTFTGTPTYSGGTANGVAYLNGSKQLTTGSALVFDGSNLGLGVTPSAWSGLKAFELGTQKGNSVNSAGYTDIRVGANCYNNGTNWIYSASFPATYYQQYNGIHSWNIAPSGTAGNAINFTQAMTLDSSGNLLVGTTSSNARLSVNSAGTTSATYVFVGQNSANTNEMTVRSDGAGFLNSSAWTYSSDATLKENIEYLDSLNCLSLIVNAKPVKFDYIEGQKSNYGYIAQDVEQWLPEAISENPNGKLGLQDGFINVLGTGAIKALNQLIQEQQAIIEQLKADVAELKGAK